MIKKEVLKNWSINSLQDAWHIATKMHDGQKYGGQGQGEQVEYMNHIGSVVFEVITAVRVDEDMNGDLAITCAVLHDTLEDTKLTYRDIEEKFGAQIASGVLALTKDSSISDKKEKMTDSLKRIKAQPREIHAVKMADRITNLFAPPFYWDNKKKREYLEEARLIHSELQSGCKYLADRLAIKISQYERFIV
jgi:(p)ppGpp synthase/HD superfamily hydrolase